MNTEVGTRADIRVGRNTEKEGKNTSLTGVAEVGTTAAGSNKVVEAGGSQLEGVIT